MILEPWEAEHLGVQPWQPQQLHFHDSQINMLRKIQLESRVLPLRKKEEEKNERNH